EAQRAGLAGHAATGDASDHVEGVDQTGGREGLLGDLLVQLVRQVLLERLAVDGPDAGARHDADAGDGLLTTAGGRSGGDDRGDLAGRGRAGRLRRVGDALVVGGVLDVFGGGLSHDEPALRLLGDLRDLERLGLLGGVRMIRAGVDLQLGDQLTAETVLRQHAANRLLDRLAGVLLEQVAVSDLLESTGVTTVAVDVLVRAL